MNFSFNSHIFFCSEWSAIFPKKRSEKKKFFSLNASEFIDFVERNLFLGISLFSLFL